MPTWSQCRCGCRAAIPKRESGCSGPDVLEQPQLAGTVESECQLTGPSLLMTASGRRVQRAGRRRPTHNGHSTAEFHRRKAEAQLHDEKPPLEAKPAVAK